MLECRDQSDVEQRLGCYDRLAERLQLAGMTPDAPDPIEAEAGNHPVGAAAAATPASASAPAAAAVVPPSAESASITSRISKVSNTARGHRAFTLENGQTWIELEVGRQPVKPGQTVTVNKRPRRHVMQLEGMPDIGVRLAD